MGGAGDDFIYGGTGNETLIGGAGDNYIQTGSGNERIIGGSGDNLLVQTVDADQTLTNSTLTGRGNDTYSEVQRIRLTGGVDKHTFYLNSFTELATLTSVNGQDVVAATDDTNFVLADGRLTTADGASVDLVNISAPLSREVPVTTRLTLADGWGLRR